mgnify:CR=1 FL=1
MRFQCWEPAIVDFLSTHFGYLLQAISHGVYVIDVHEELSAIRIIGHPICKKQRMSEEKLKGQRTTYFSVPAPRAVFATALTQARQSIIYIILLDGFASLIAFIKASSAALLICIKPTIGWLQRVMLAFLRLLYQHSTGNRLWALNLAACLNAMINVLILVSNLLRREKTYCHPLQPLGRWTDLDSFGIVRIDDSPLWPGANIVCAPLVVQKTLSSSRRCPSHSVFQGILRGCDKQSSLLWESSCDPEANGKMPTQNSRTRTESEASVDPCTRFPTCWEIAYWVRFWQLRVAELLKGHIHEVANGSFGSLPFPRGKKVGKCNDWWNTNLFICKYQFILGHYESTRGGRFIFIYVYQGQKSNILKNNKVFCLGSFLRSRHIHANRS